MFTLILAIYAFASLVSQILYAFQKKAKGEVVQDYENTTPTVQPRFDAPQTATDQTPTLTKPTGEFRFNAQTGVANWGEDFGIKTN